MSYSPYYYEEILRHHRLEMERDHVLAQHVARIRAEQPRTARFERSRRLFARVPRFRRARVAYG